MTFVGAFALVVTAPRVWRIFRLARFNPTVVLTHLLSMTSYAAMLVAGLAILGREGGTAGSALTISTVTAFTYAIVSAWWFLARVGESEGATT